MELETALEVRPQTERLRPVAAAWHTALIVIVQALLAYRGIMGAQHMRELTNPDRIRLYERTMLSEWIVLALVLGGVWLHGSPMTSVLGKRWSSMQQILRDIGLGVLFLMVTIALSSIAEGLSGGASHGVNKAAQFLLPQGRLEMILWAALSFSAGFCEEAVYRGYLQRQFMAMTNSVPAGILLSAVMFGAAHSYQGWRQAVQIGVLGLMGGTFAYWCKTVRPGMIAHTLQDLLGGMMKH